MELINVFEIIAIVIFVTVIFTLFIYQAVKYILKKYFIYEIKKNEKNFREYIDDLFKDE